MYYYFSRGYVPVIKDYLMAGDSLMPSINASKFSEISSAFSLTYSLFQIIGGFALDKVGVRIMYPILGIGASICTYMFAGYTEHNMGIYIRYMLGACFSISSTGSYKYLSIFWKDKFNILANMMPVLMCASAAFASTQFVKLYVAKIGWRNFLKFLSGFGLLITILLLITFNILFNLYKNHNSSMEENNNSNNLKEENLIKEEESISIFTSIKEVILLPGFMYVCLFAIAGSSAAYVLMDGWGDTLYQLKYPGIIPFMAPASANMIGNAIGYMYNIIADKLTLKKQMLIYGIVNLFALILILYVKICTRTFLTCCGLLGFVCASQNIGFLFLQRKLSNKYLGLGFGLLNFLCMFFGCTLAQKFAGTILDSIKNKNILSGMAPYLGYKYADLLSAFKFLMIPALLALLAAIFFKDNSKSNKK
jgi:MFS family permease